jgi:hypothetical protein
MTNTQEKPRYIPLYSLIDERLLATAKKKHLTLPLPYLTHINKADADSTHSAKNLTVGSQLAQET